MHAGRRRDLNKRDPQAIEGEHVVVYSLGGLFLKADRLNLPAIRKSAVECDKRGPLESAGVGTVYDELPHGMDLRDGCHAEHPRDLEGDGQCFRIEGGRRFLIVLNKAGAVIGVITEPAQVLHLLSGSTVNLAKLTLGCTQIPPELPVMFIKRSQDRRAPAEEFLCGIQLLVDLNSRLQAEALIIHGGTSL